MTLPGLDNLDGLWTKEQWAERAHALTSLFFQSWMTSEPPKVSEPEILERLAKRGRAELPGWLDGGANRVSTMSDAEAAVRWFLHAHEEQSQASSALMCLEPRQAIPRLK